MMDESKSPVDLAALMTQLVEEAERRISDRMERHLSLIFNRIERNRQPGTAEQLAYTVEEAAVELKRKRFTVRQWCNLGQVKAQKVRGKGRQGEWRILAEEVAQAKKDGPSPIGTYKNSGQEPSSLRRAA